VSGIFLVEKHTYPSNSSHGFSLIPLYFPNFFIEKNLDDVSHPKGFKKLLSWRLPPFANV